MVKRKNTRGDQRRTRRLLSRWVPLSVGFFLVIILFWTIRVLWLPAQIRQTYVILDEPVRVVSFDAQRSKVTAVDIPKDTVIPAAFGYGKYTVEAIISLDAIDNRNGALITQSISTALGLPVAGVVRPQGEHIGGSMNIGFLRRIFSFRAMLRAQWIPLVLTVAALPSDAVRVVDIAAAIIPMISPDGSTLATLDESRVDYILGDTFFDAGVRGENLSVAVYNTTGVPAVGERASRTLSHVGIQLVFVGNLEPESKRCTILGSEEARASKTALLIQKYATCDMKEGGVGKEMGADLTVLLGTEFAGRYR